jgi:hypothetical protein
MTKKATKPVKKTKPAKRPVTGMAGRTKTVKPWKASKPLKPGDKVVTTNNELLEVVRPKKGPGSGKPNIHMKAKALAIDTTLPVTEEASVELYIDPEVVDELEIKLGRPTMLTPDLGIRVCTLIAQGNSLEAIEKLGDGLPCERTVYRWLAANKEGGNARLYAAFRHAFVRARELRADTRPEEVAKLLARLTDPDTLPAMKIDAQTARVAADIHAVLQKMEAPQVYDRKRLELTGKGGGPVVVKKSTELSDAELMLLAAGGMEGSE